MTKEEVCENLCYYDDRNPNNDNDCYDKEELKQIKSRKNCSCSNCFYGRTKLAEELLKYVKQSTDWK